MNDTTLYREFPHDGKSVSRRTAKHYSDSTARGATAR